MYCVRDAIERMRHNEVVDVVIVRASKFSLLKKATGQLLFLLNIDKHMCYLNSFASNVITVHQNADHFHALSILVKRSQKEKLEYINIFRYLSK